MSVEHIVMGAASASVAAAVVETPSSYSLTASTNSTISSTGSGNIASVQITGSTILTVFRGTNNYLYGIITGGTQTLLTTDTVGDSNFISIVKNSTTSALVFFGTTSSSNLILIRISGTTISTGSVTNALSGATGNPNLSMCNLSPTYSVIFYRTGSATICMRLITHDTTAVTGVSGETVIAVEANSDAPICASYNSTTAILSYMYLSGTVYVRAVRPVTLSGTTLTVGNTVVVNSATTGSVPSSICILDSSTAMLSYLTTSGISSNIIKLNGASTLVPGYPTLVADRTTNNFYPITSAAISSNSAVVGYISGAGTGFIINAVAINGNTIVRTSSTVNLYSGGTVSKIDLCSVNSTTAYASFYNGGNTCHGSLITLTSSGPMVSYVDDVFSTYTYTGNGSTLTINNGIDLAGSGGLVWVKSRNTGYSNVLVDTVRGANQTLFSDANVVNQNYSGSGTVNTFTSTGFNVGTNAITNQSTVLYTSWTFRKAPKFFDIVSYTGDGVSNKNINHSLGVIPGFILVKRTDSTTYGDWVVAARCSDQNYALGPQGTFGLNLTGAASGTTFNPTYTSTYINIDNVTNTVSVCNVSGATYVMYLFAHDPSSTGIIQCGSSVGGTTTTVNLGWEPQWLMVKKTNAAQDWFIIDDMRGLNAVQGDQALSANVVTAEPTASSNFNLTPTGFTFAGLGTTSDTYIYVAIRRPNRPPTVGTQVFSPVTWSGTGTTQQITTGFPPDACLAFCRNRQATNSTWWFNRLRGVNSQLYTNDTTAELTDTGKAFTMTGLSNNSGNLNSTYLSSNYVGNFFKRAPGFFDIVCWTSTGTAETAIPHSLNVLPELIIIKAASTVSNWFVGASVGGNVGKISASGTGGFTLNTSAAQTQNITWSSTYPNSSTRFNPYDVSGLSYTYTNGTRHVAYLFATLAGVSKVGSYTGNGSSQTINCSFAAGARFILIKRTDVAGDWYVWDTTRGIVTATDPHLSLNTIVAEVTTDDSIDPDNTGFIVNQVAATNINVSSATYIFLAIA